MKLKISLIGLGWFGTPMAQELKKNGFEVFGTTRSPEKKEALLKEGIKASLLTTDSKPDPELLLSDIIILNIPPFEGQLEWFKSWDWNEKSWPILISSTSVEKKLSTKNASLLKTQEEWVSSNFSQWTILRFGGLLGGGRHPGKHLSGKKDIKGRLWPISLLDRDYAIKFTQQIIQEKKMGQILRVANLTGMTREEFYTNYCRENKLPLPEFDQFDLSEK